MKIRQGFVSNSSSSSFVIAFKDIGTCKHCGLSPPDIIGLVDSSNYDCDTATKAIGLDNVMAEVKDYCGVGGNWANEKTLANFTNIVAKISDCINDGFEVAVIDVSYHDTSIHGMLQNANDKHLKILWSWD